MTKTVAQDEDVPMDIDKPVTDDDDSNKLNSVNMRPRATRTGARGTSTKRKTQDDSEDELQLSPSKIKPLIRKVFDGVEVPTMSPTKRTPVKAAVSFGGRFSGHT